jgi:HPt (histidine-containing phosphotransfer) domain-containing protein
MSTGEEPLNLARLRELYGDETVKELLSMSVGEARGLVDDVERGIQDKNLKVVAAAAHQLKGLAVTMTIHDLHNISMQIEGDAHAENWDNITGKQNQLRRAFNEFEAYVGTINL